MPGITHLRSVDISVPNPVELLSFYEEVWGLRRAPSGDSDRIALRAKGAEHHVLRMVAGPGHSLKQIELGVEISDRYENDLMIFMRCNSQHHCLVLAPGQWWTGYGLRWPLDSGYPPGSCFFDRGTGEAGTCRRGASASRGQIVLEIDRIRTGEPMDTEPAPSASQVHTG